MEPTRAPLAFSSETGRTQPVGADDISRLLAEHHPLRLVVLNACDTGRGSAADAFSSTAAALIRREVPAVVAMQFEITDEAAIRFAQTFYQNVAKRRPVDDSAMRARRALRLARKDTLEWGIPVLYLRAPDGRIFDAIISPPQLGPFPDLVPTPEAVEAPLAAILQETFDPLTPPPVEPRVSRYPKAVQTLRHRKGVNAVAFSPDGHRLATASADKTAQVWDVGVALGRVVHNGWLEDVTGVAFSPDGRRLATASWDSTARVWDAASGQELAKVTHGGWVRGVAFSPDGRWLATASDDMTARVWDAASGQELAKVTHGGGVRGVAFSPDGRWLATASADGTARIWVLSDDE